ncbi:hypothetical protein niasHS_013777 [Heterodera schachtii]|uniref:Fido domain-containing protein n=1 Tax=Heterodera schachtii TaxID=97005 RepID=A0ABD2IQJ8_HETSC
MNSSRDENGKKDAGTKPREKGLKHGENDEDEAEAAAAEAEAEEEEEEDDDDTPHYSPFADDAKLLPALLKPIFQVEQFTLKTFFELHLEVMGRRDTRAGCLRTFDMTVGDFEPMPHEEVPAAMQDFIRWFNQHLKAKSMTAGEFAARAHHTLVYIHPFYNGNGRTARLLMNFILMRRGFQPIILPEEKRDEYYECLVAASSMEKNITPFITFVSFHQQCAQDRVPALIPSLPSSSS